MFFTITWVLVVAAAMTLSAFFSYKQNITQDKIWFFAIWGVGLIPLWALVAKYSKNLVVDAVIFDTTVAVVFFVALVYFTGQSSELRWYQYLGFALTLIGTILLKLGTR
jgi:hypothetical protein